MLRQFCSFRIPTKWLLVFLLVTDFCQTFIFAEAKSCPTREVKTFQENGTFVWLGDPQTNLQKPDGRHVNLSCRDAGYIYKNNFGTLPPPSEMIWMRNGREMKNMRKAYVGGRSKIGRSCVENTVLRFKNLKLHDSGDYKCILRRKDTDQIVLSRKFKLQVVKRGM